MALVLTTEEQAYVQKRRKDAANLPVYYDAALRSNIQISRDFEAFLILAPDELKTEANVWIQKAGELQQDTSIRDQLVALAATNEAANAARKIEALDTVLADFSKFRTQFPAGGQFAQVPEVQKFLFDLQRSVEELSVSRERAEFDNVASQVVLQTQERSRVKPEEIEELRSWSGVLSEYLRG